MDDERKGAEEMKTEMANYLEQNEPMIHCDDQMDNYVTLMNNCLPKDIRILGYAVVPDSFKARFDCVYREYKYFFDRGSLDIEKMREASKKLIGYHDFRNF